MPLRPNMKIQEYIEVFFRRKWLIIFSFLFVLFGAGVYSVVTPEQFKSTTTILLIPQRVPEGYVKSTVSTPIEDRLSTIEQQVMSRTILIAVMDELGLFKEDRGKKPLEVLVEEIRERIYIQVDNGKDLISLSFVHENRQMAMLVVSRLASFFINENLRVREQQAVGTSEFLESQLKEMKDKLEIAEEKIKSYKMSFMGELPQQMDANLSMLRSLQDRFRVNADAIRAAQDRKVFLESQINGLERLGMTVVSDDGKTERIISSDPEQAFLAELSAKRLQLANLSTKYTDHYPDVERLKRDVDQLEKRLGAMQQSSATTGNSSEQKGAGSQSPPRLISPEYRRLRSQVASIELEISSMEKDREKIKKYMANVQEKVERSPRREQEMIALTRDYENLKKSYDDLLRKKLDSDVAQSLEKRQKGVQFQVLDPANFPERPFKPDRRKILGVALSIALAIGFGGAIGLEIFNPKIQSQQEFSHFFQLPVFGTIPILKGQMYDKKRIYRRVAVFGGIVTFIAAVTTFLLMFNERIRLILFS